MAFLIRCSAACRRLLLATMLLPALVFGASSADFIALCYHEVERDGSASLTKTAVTAGDLAAQFAWLQASGYQPVSLQQILDARQGGPALPPKAVLLTFDDGRRDVFTRVLPLLRLFNYPALVALVGNWLDVPAGGTVDYDGTPQPREHFVTWEEVREMQRSGLVEIASHSYDLHRGVLANPQGNTQPAAITRRYENGRYETDETYLKRIRDDLARNRDLIVRKTGIAPRAIVWPYGRSNGAAQQIASELGMTVGMTLEDGINTAKTPLVTIKRFLIEDTPSLQSYAEAVRQRWLPDPQRSVRVVPSAWSDAEAGLSQALDQLQRIAPNIAFVDPRAAGDAVLFPTTHRRVAADRLNHTAWQIERRAGVPVFIDLPAAWLGDQQLLADLARHVNFAGLRLPVAPGDPAATAAIETLHRWRWPLTVVYAPAVASPADDWQRLPAGDLVLMPVRDVRSRVVPQEARRRLLLEFDAASVTPAEAATIAATMRSLDADGYRQFGLDALPVSGFEPVWRELSLRSQPLLP
jgi:peptidoglycan/xylan/chitin deacetylase (PgdA/CDA1 family)